ncbi:MAG: hypothetical protein ACYC8T_03090 [Myxococcaceae bacterium]
MTSMTSKMVAMLLGLALAGPALAAAPGQREVRQQQRIAQGVRSGELTPHEAVRLERKEARIHREIRRAKADGNFSAVERARVQRHQNQVSRKIYRQKHDAQAR